jgi:hypothetical protein
LRFADDLHRQLLIKGHGLDLVFSHVVQFFENFNSLVTGEKTDDFLAGQGMDIGQLQDIRFGGYAV